MWGLVDGHNLRHLDDAVNMSDFDFLDLLDYLDQSPFSW